MSEVPIRAVNSRDDQQHQMESPMSAAIRQAQNTIVIAARLYKEFALSASHLLRPGTYTR